MNNVLKEANNVYKKETSGGSTPVGPEVYNAESYVWGTGNTPNKTLINEAFYRSFLPIGTGEANTVGMWVEVIGGTPTAVDCAIYNDAGTQLASVASPVTVAATGLLILTLDSTISLTGNVRYWCGLAGSLGSNTQFSGDVTLTNSTSYNRYVATSPTVAASLPDGVATAGGFWFRLALV